MIPLRCNVALVAGALLLAACSSGPSQSSTATDPRTTDTASTTTSYGAIAPDGPASAGDDPASNHANGSSGDGVVASTAPSSGAATSAAVTTIPTTVDPSLKRALTDALPVAADLPAGWSLLDERATYLLEPGEGDFVGACGGPNADRRAVLGGVIAVAHGATYESPAGFQGFVSLYAFADDPAAAAFVERTRAIGSCTRNYSVREGSAAGEYDGFGDTSYDRVVRWEVAEITRTEPVEPTDTAAGARDGVVLHREDALSTTADGKRFTAVETSVTVFERHGRLVMAASLSSYCCTTGYQNPAGSNRVSLSDLADLLLAFGARVSAAVGSLP